VVLRRQRPKLMDAGTVLTFGGLLAYFAVIGHSWSLAVVRLAVHFSLLRIAVFSLAIRRPFTQAYAREHVAEEHWGNPSFVRRSYIVTGVWGVAYAAMVAADVAWMEIPGLPSGLVSWVTMVALLGAVGFRVWEPDCPGFRVRKGNDRRGLCVADRIEVGVLQPTAHAGNWPGATGPVTDTGRMLRQLPTEVV
jgi:hypothetical protein